MQKSLSFLSKDGVAVYGLGVPSHAQGTQGLILTVGQVDFPGGAWEDAVVSGLNLRWSHPRP